MSAEFTFNFSDNSWCIENRNLIGKEIVTLKIFVTNDYIEYHLAGYEIDRQPKDWLYDVRIFLQANNLFIEISAHPLSIETDLTLLFTWFGKQTQIFIIDDDVEDYGWLIFLVTEL